MKRVLCLWLPHWPLQRICLVQPELKGRPVVLHGGATSAPAAASGRGTGQQVRHCSRAAVAAGVRPGMPLAEAQAILERHLPSAPSQHNPLPLEGGGLGWGWGWSQETLAPPPRPSPTRGEGEFCAVDSSRNAHIAAHDSQADRKLLQLLAGWCARYSPLVGMEQSDEPSVLFFDITGCAHLFGGEKEMAAQVARDFRHAGYSVHIAVADTIGAAWAAVRFRKIVSRAAASDDHRYSRSAADSRGSVPVTIIPPGEQPALLRALPVAALRLPANAIETLHELGIQHIRQLQDLLRSTLPARFGPAVLERLDQALGLTPELIVPVPPVEPVEADWSFEEPTDDRRALESVLHRLIGEVTATLAARQEGAQRLSCRLLCAGKEPVDLTIGTLQPTAVAAHLCELTRLQLERTTLAGEVLAVHVEVTASGPLGTQQQEFFDSGVNRDGQRHLAVLLDRLSSRLGEKSVLRPRLGSDPQPEYASRLVAALAGGEIANCKLKIEKGKLEETAGVSSEFRIPNSTLPSNPKSKIRNPKSSPLVPDYQFIMAPAARPLRLKPRPIPIEVVSVVPDGPPIRFRWHAAEHLIQCRWGPERIETGWWRGPHVQRDYYRVETATGQRFWLFRQNDTGKWFLHGAFE